MTKEQYEAARAVLEKDCSIRYRYVEDGESCAVGALALAAGVLPERFAETDNAAKVGALQDVAEAVRQRFGIKLAVLTEIQYQNDVHEEVAWRRNAVLNVLELAYNQWITKM